MSSKINDGSLSTNIVFLDMRCLLSIPLVWLLSGGCQTESTRSTALPDGLYLVVATGTEKDHLMAADSAQAVIRFNHKFLEENEQQISRFVVETSDYVPLTLANAPDSITQPDGRTKLMLTLNDRASQKLSDFTGKNVNGRVALVVDGEAVTYHKIRTRIEGGHLQITRCTDYACQFLYYELEDNVEP